MSHPASRSPSGQWYPQQQQQMNPQQQWSNPQQQWSPSSGATTPTNYYNPNATSVTNLNNSQLLLAGTTTASTAGHPPPPPSPGGPPPPGPMPGMPGPMPGMPGMPMPYGAGYPPQQQSMCSCCDNTPGGGCCGPQGGGGCFQMPGEPLDPYVCPEPFPGQQRQCECIYTCCDYTFFLMCLFFILSITGFAVVLGTSNVDNIFAAFKVDNTVALQEAMGPYIKWKIQNCSELMSSSSSSETDSDPNPGPGPGPGPGADDIVPLYPMQFRAVGDLPGGAVEGDDDDEVECPLLTIPRNCTETRLKGSFGGVCMENNLDANVFATQLAFWNNSRTTLYFVAMLFSIIALVYAILVHRQIHPSDQSGMPMLPPEKQAELSKLPPVQQQQFMMEYMRSNPEQLLRMQQQQQQGCCGGGAIEVYDTPFYEFMRIAWFFLGIVAFLWTLNLLISFWTFSSFYEKNTTGPLRKFWSDYSTKFNGSLIPVTIFLAWPLFNFFLELVVLIVGILPWLIMRNTCKQGVAQYRPSLPLSKLPGWIRTDMFFMDFQDLKRLGFSRAAWIMLTGEEKPYCDSCEDPTVDRDPDMTAMLQARAQWQQQFYGMMIPGWRPPEMMIPPPGMPVDNSSIQAAPTSGQAPEYPTEEVGKTERRRRRRSKGVSEETGTTRRRRRSKSSRRRRSRSNADPPTAAAAGLDESAAGGEGRSRSRRRRRSSVARSGQEGNGEETPRRRRRSRSVSKEVSVSMEPPVAGAAGQPGEEGKRERKHKHRGSRSVSKEKKHRHRDNDEGSKAKQDLDALMEL